MLGVLRNGAGSAKLSSVIFSDIYKKIFHNLSIKCCLIVFRDIFCDIMARPRVQVPKKRERRPVERYDVLQCDEKHLLGSKKTDKWRKVKEKSERNAAYRKQVKEAKAKRKRAEARRRAAEAKKKRVAAKKEGAVAAKKKGAQAKNKK